MANVMRMGNYRAAIWITVAVSIVGFALIIGGAALTGIAYTEVRPNFADSNYARYIGANLQRIVGPILLSFGALLLLGGCIFIVFAMTAMNKQYNSNAPSKSSQREDTF